MKTANKRGRAFAKYLLGEHDAAKLRRILKSVDNDFADFLDELGLGQTLRFHSPEEYIEFAVGCAESIQ